MYLFRVTLHVKKDWMNTSRELQWAVCADTGEGALEQVTDTIDFSGVTIEKAQAIKEDLIVII